MIDFGGGMIFPDSYDRDQPSPPECPCEDGEPCPAHPDCSECGRSYDARHPEDENGLCWYCNSARIAALPSVLAREDFSYREPSRMGMWPGRDDDRPF